MKYNSALVLEGGGMRSSYTNGVLDFFMEVDIDFTYIVGVSAGVGTGINFVSKQIGRTKTLAFDYSNDKRVVGIRNFLLKGSYFNLDYLYNVLDKEVYFDYDTFKKSNSIFKAGCFNLNKGIVEYFDKKQLEESNLPLIATSSLPIISKIVKIGDYKYLDGGIIDAIPLKRAIADGNKKFVVILTNPIEYRREKESSLTLIKLLYKRYPNLIKALENRHIEYNNIIEKINEMEASNEIFVIRPSIKLPVTRYSKDIKVLEETYNQGYSDAKRIALDLVNYLKED